MEKLSKPNLELADWKSIYEVATICGNAHHPRSFIIDTLECINKIAEFNQSIVFFLDANEKVVGQYTKHVSDKYSNMYLNHYHSMYGYVNPFGSERENPLSPTIILFNWFRDTYFSDELSHDFIKSRKLTYSADFVLYDLNSKPRAIISLDRTVNKKFTEKELSNLSLTVALLNSVYKNFFFRDEKLGNVSQESWAKWRLTGREIEIVDLLCQGVKPKEIANTLFISIPTTYKHIQHIHEKLHVSSNAELIALMLGAGEI